MQPTEHQCTQVYTAQQSWACETSGPCVDRSVSGEGNMNPWHMLGMKQVDTQGL